MCDLCDRQSASDYEPPTPLAWTLGKALTEDDHWNELHIIVEDGNIEDEHVAACLACAETSRERELLNMFAALSEEQRLSAIAIHLGIIK